MFFACSNENFRRYLNFSSFSLSFFPINLKSIGLCLLNQLTESLVRYRLLSEPELSNLLKTTLSNGSLQSAPICHQPPKDEAENVASAELDLTDNLIKEQKSPRLLATDDNDNNSQNRNNNNLVQT